MSTSDLLSTLCAAPCGSRDLDEAIARRMGWVPALHNLYRFWNDPTGHRQVTFPEFSTSTDAALSRLPEGWRWNAGFSGTMFWIVIWPPAAHDGTEYSAGAPTLPLAINIAIEKAKGAQP